MVKIRLNIPVFAPWIGSPPKSNQLLLVATLRSAVTLSTGDGMTIAVDYGHRPLVNCYNGAYQYRTNKLCGRPPQYARAPACNGSTQRQPWARPAEPGPMSQYAPSQPAGSRPHMPPAGRMYGTDVRRRQTDRRQTSHRRQTASSLNAPA